MYQVALHRYPVKKISQSKRTRPKGHIIVKLGINVTRFKDILCKVLEILSRVWTLNLNANGKVLNIFVLIHLLKQNI